jgi:uncharacterized membrane protein
MSLAGSDLLVSTRRAALLRGLGAWRRATSRDDGALLVMTVLMMPALLGIIGLMLDGALAYAARRELQDAADNAALAGAMQVDLQYFSDTGLWRVADTGNVPGAPTAHEAAQEICRIYGATCHTDVLADFDGRTFHVVAEKTKRTVLIHLVTGTPNLELAAEATSVMVPGF